MAFVESIELEDKVSPNALQASKSVGVLSSTLETVTRSLVKAEALGNIKSVADLTMKSDMLRAAISAVPPELLKEVEAAKALIAEESALAKASAATAVAQQKSAADALASKERAAAEGKRLGDQAAKQGESFLKGQAAEQKKAASEQKKTADIAAKAIVKAEEEKEKAFMHASQAATEHAAKITAAMTAGKEIVGAAAAGMRTALTSLAAGDVRGAIGGVTEAIGGMAKALDLVVPGLGQAVAAVVSIVGGIAGITAGLVQSGVELAISSTQAKQQMVSMFDALGAGEITGLQVDDMLSSMSAKLGITKDAMVPLVKEFTAMGVTSQGALEKMTTAALSAKALVGGADSGAEAFSKLSKKIELASATGVGLKIPIKGLGSLAEMGLTVDDVAKKMGVSAKELGASLTAGSVDAKKFGGAMQDALIEKGAGPLETMGNSLTNLKAIFQQSVGDMFEDMGRQVGPLMTQVKGFFSIFSQANPVGQQLKQGIVAVFTWVFEKLTNLVPLVRVFFTQLMIYGLQAYIAVKPLIATIEGIGGASKDGPGLMTVVMKGMLETIEAVGHTLKVVIDKFVAFANTASGSRLISTVLSTLWTVLKSVGIAVLFVVGVFVGLLVAINVIAVAVWATIGAVIAFAATLTSDLAGAVTSVITFFASFGSAVGGAVTGAVSALAEWVAGAPQYALEFISGLVGGITNGAGAVASAVTNLAGGAIGAIRGVFDSHSPSKVMLDMGQHDIGGALATGVGAAEPDVYGASSDLAKASVSGVAQGGSAAPSGGQAAAAAAAASSSEGGSGGGAGGISVTIEAGAIIIQGAGKAAGDITEEMLAALFERLALMLGRG